MAGYAKSPTDSCLDPDGFDELIDELPVGYVDLDETGRVHSTNPNARLLLDSREGARLSSVLERLARRAKETGHSTEANLSLGTAGEVRVLVAKARCHSGFVAVVSRDLVSRLRVELSVLRGMLASATSAAEPRAGVRQAVELLAGSMPGATFGVFEPDVSGKSLICTVRSGGGQTTKLFPPQPADSPSSMVAMAFRSHRPVHVRNDDGPMSLLADREEANLSAVSLPVRSQGAGVGVLHVCAPSDYLGEGELRLLMGLADALGSLLRHARDQHALDLERRSVEALLADLPDAVLEQELGGTILRAAGAAERILKRAPTALVGERVEHLLAPGFQSLWRELVERARKGSALGELELTRGDGTVAFAEVRVHLAKTLDDKEVLRVIVRDLSVQRRLEKEAATARDIVAKRDRLATIGQLAAGVAHEINNPLAFLKSNLSSLSQYVERLGDLAGGGGSGDSFDEMEQDLKDMVVESLDGVERIAAIVQALRGTARQRPNERVRFDPARAVNDALTIFRGAHRSNCVVLADVPKLPEVIGSASALGQIVLNLLQNGLDAMGGRGRLKVVIRDEGKKIRLEVSDEGTGIPADVQPSLFEPFFTTKEVGKGTGLGLYICRQVASEMGGSIAFDTGPSGTTFRVELPVAPERESDG